jgi:AhpD family alkylhydroperoxidase
MQTNYPEIHEYIAGMMKKLGGEIPKTMGAFSQLHEAAAVDGALSRKTKELLALSISVVVRCDGCIAFHVHDALEAGASHDEIIEAIGVAIMMGGGPAVVYGAEALDALAQFEAKARQN